MRYFINSSIPFRVTGPRCTAAPPAAVVGGRACAEPRPSRQSAGSESHYSSRYARTCGDMYLILDGPTFERPGPVGDRSSTIDGATKNSRSFMAGRALGRAMKALKVRRFLPANDRPKLHVNRTETNANGRAVKTPNNQGKAIRAPRSGRGGRRFKSCHSDQYLAQIKIAAATKTRALSAERLRDAADHQIGGREGNSFFRAHNEATQETCRGAS